MRRLLIRPHGPDAREALWAAIDEAKAGDPLAPVTVATPSPFSGLSLRRLLATRAGRPGLVNVRFLPLARVAELLGAPTLAAAGRRPLTPPLRAAAIRGALTGGPPRFGAVTQHAATERSLARTFRELRRIPDPQLTQVAGRSERAADVVTLYRRFREQAGAFYDVEDLLDAAAGAARRSDASVTDLGVMVLYLPGELAANEVALIEALADAGRAAVVVGLTGDADADQPVVATSERLRPVLAPEAALELPLAPLAAGTRLVSAPEPADEIAEVVRGIAERVDHGRPLHRMAVLYRAREPYARVVHEQLAAANIPTNGPGHRTLADSVAGRALLGALALPDVDFRRDALVEWLAGAPIIEPEREAPAPSSRWDVLSRAANVVAGLDQWDERLQRHAAEIEVELATLAAAGEDSDDDTGPGARRRDDLDQVSRLRAFLPALAAALEPPSESTWPALAAWSVTLLTTVLGSEPRLGRWPEAELTAYRQIRERLGGLAAVAEVGEHADLRLFRRAIEAELDAATGPAGRFGTGAFVGPVSDATGTEFDTIFVVGMNEGTFPPRPRDDALLPDRERGGTELPLRRGRARQERREYLAALAGAPERVLSFSRADSRGQRKLRPSRWLLETARAHHGAAVYADDLERIGSADWLRVIESFEAAVTSGAPPASLADYDLAALAGWRAHDRDPTHHPLAGVDSTLRAGWAAYAGRRSRRLTPFDGLVGPLGDLAPSPDRAVSPTSLEDWATCPFRYLLGRVLGLRVLLRPEALTQIEGRHRGSLMHDALARFIESVPARPRPSDPWTPDEHARLRAIAEECCDELERAGLTGKPLLWRLAKRRILRDLDAVLAADEDYRADLGVVPHAVEVSFGLDPDGAPAVPVELGGGVRVAFRGRIDRVDRAPDGSRLAVVDYKTGSPDDPAEILADPVARGTRLQLAVYAIAARAAYGEVPVRASYWYTRNEGDAPPASFDLDDENLERVHDVLRLAVESVQAGMFPARPGVEGYFGYENCTYCDFDPVCPVDRGAQWERKRTDPRIGEYVALAEPDESDGTEATGA